MKLIVGLGNPTPKFESTRHNTGEYFVRRLLDKQGGVLYKEGVLGNVSRFTLNNKEILALLPLTFMNDSGVSVFALMEKYNLRNEDILVVCDDLDLPFKKIRFRQKGGSGGHKGIKSIINFLETEEFARIKFGIGRPTNLPVYDYVTSKFTKDEQIEISNAFDYIEELIINWLKMS